MTSVQRVVTVENIPFSVVRWTGPGNIPRPIKHRTESIWLPRHARTGNSRHTADPDIQNVFWGIADGYVTREQVDENEHAALQIARAARRA